MNDCSSLFYCSSPFINLPHSTALRCTLIMPIVRLGCDKNTFERHWFDSTRIRTWKVRIPRSPKAGGGQTLYSFDHRICCVHFGGLYCDYLLKKSIFKSFSQRVEMTDCKIYDIYVVYFYM